MKDYRMDNKPEIIKAFLPALKMTRAGSDIDRMDYIKYPDNSEEVRIFFLGDGIYRKSQHVDVTADSGAAMMLDIIKALI